MKTQMLDIRGFQMLSDALGGFKPIDAICQFKYRDHLISISTAGLSKGACQTEVSVFGGDDYRKELTRTHTVEEAIEFVNDIPVKRVFTKEEFLTESSQSEVVTTNDDIVKYVLTTEEQNQLLNNTNASNNLKKGEICTVSDDKVFWFTDTPSVAFGVLPEQFKFGFMICPHRLWESKDPSKGVVKTAEDFIGVYCQGMRQITTLDELVEYLNTTYG